jgi:hypothetical protein
MLNTLSRHEVERLHDASQGELGDLVRRCALAVLNSGNQGDDAEELLAQYHDFEIEVQQVNRALRLELINAPGSPFVDGQIIEGVQWQQAARSGHFTRHHKCRVRVAAQCPGPDTPGRP